ncbi:hypothetical protein PG990_001632 [Apiospora arundinis]
MASPAVQARFALLVGVNSYLHDGSRRLPNDNIVSLTNLQGAVNDVRTIHTLLRHEFQFNDFTVLTSSPSPLDPRIPSESDDKWPTYVNIKKAFDNIYDKARSGDVFLFHFSGHGAPLCTTPSSPADGRSNDPSLMTADYCCGKPAIRGWELNEWLRRFNEKNVRVIVLLDSCYSGGAWRNDGRFRSPDNWTPPPNLPADEAAVQGTQKKPGHRDGDLGECWDINPKAFTLVAACQSTEMAAERHEDGAAHGAFTLALKTYFQDPSNASTPTYRSICDRATGLLASWNLSQKPQVFGRDKLAFLEDYEPFLFNPIAGVLQNGVVSISVGRIHGFSKRTEFITTSTSSKLVVSISELDDHRSRAEIVSGFINDPSPFIELVPFRWSVKETLEVVIDPNLGQQFRKELIGGLGKRIAGDIQYPGESGLAENRGHKAIWFQVGSNENGSIDIFGPEQLVGGPGPVRGWKTRGESDNEKARESARAIAHLVRFGQILHLRNESQDTAPFRVTFESENSGNQHKVHCVFQNVEDEELHFAVLILSSGFHVKQLFPSTDTLYAVPLRGRKSFSFTLTVRDELRRNAGKDRQHRYRDIIRTVVTRGKSLSLKSMELPDIWNADQWDKQRSSDPGGSGGLGRDANLLEDFSWWIQDDQKFTA